MCNESVMAARAQPAYGFVMRYVLLVNDCDEALDEQKQSLQRSGFVVIPASSAEQALDRASVVEPDVIVCHLSESGACSALADAVQSVLSAIMASEDGNEVRVVAIPNQSTTGQKL